MVTVVPKLPTIVLDDLDQHIRDLNCHHEKIVVHFHDDSPMISAGAAWSSFDEFLVVTSRTGCSVSGEHAAYRTSYSSSDMSSFAIELSATRSTLKSHTETMRFEFGNHFLSEAVPATIASEPIRIEKRQSSPTSFDVQSASLSPTANISFPSTTASASASSTAIASDIFFSHIDSTILPLNSSFASQLPSNFQPP